MNYLRYYSNENIAQMKILQIGKFFPSLGGLEKVMYDTTIGLSQKGHRCDILCTVLDNHSQGDIRLNEYASILRVPFMMKVAATMIAPAMIFRLRKIQKEYDIIHVHHPDPMACLALYLSGFKGPVVVHWHSDILKQKQLLKLYRPLQNWMLRRAEAIIGTTPTYVQESPFLQDVQNKITVIPIGIDELRPNKEQVALLKEEYAGKKIIFALGRLVGYKGFEYLIKAARQLEDDCVILIGGKGPLQATLQALIEQEGVSDKVKLIGFVSDDELPNYFGASHLFCLSSIWKTEAFAIVQVEAMSCGTPVVATKIPESGVSWVNAAGVSGMNVEPEDAEALASAIKDILSDEQLYAQLARGARQHYETMFTKELMIKRCLNLYQTIMERNCLMNGTSDI